MIRSDLFFRSTEWYRAATFQLLWHLSGHRLFPRWTDLLLPDAGG